VHDSRPFYDFWNGPDKRPRVASPHKVSPSVIYRHPRKRQHVL